MALLTPLTGLPLSPFSYDKLLSAEDRVSEKKQLLISIEKKEKVK